jgi:hypothetical protein
MAKQGTKQPYSKWYWSDWRGDPKLKLCSLAARGLWMDMLALMHEAEPYGHLLVEGVMPGIDGLAAICGRPAKEVRAAFAELEQWKVFSRTEDGTPFSRRMIRDREKAEQDKANGRKGGNPKVIRKDNGGVNPQTNPHGISQSQKPETIVRNDIELGRSSESMPDTARAPDTPRAAPPSFDPRYRETQEHCEAILNNPNCLVWGRVDAWLKQGAEPELDIYPTLERLKPNWRGRNLDYFDGAIADSIASRTKPLPAGQARASPEGRVNVDEWLAEQQGKRNDAA